ncbi:Cytochrome c [Lignipirellula cremea]|uniref:Cytochrome c n=2 Tax=Lignipirellula cremea TaxID=2528010 RepID=A0A518E123_9BACT|nr:Cytochrome c [Lignipirellula cremea]
MRLFIGLLLGGLCLLSDNVWGQASDLRPGRLSSAERDALQPGLQAAFQMLPLDTPSSDPTLADVRTVRLPALFVPAGEPATPFLAAGPFRCTFTGYLKTRLRGEARLAFAGRGAVKLWLNDEQVLAIEQGDLQAAPAVPVELAKGYNHLRLEYDSPAAGDAQLRVDWSSDEFPREPLSPRDLFHNGDDPAIRDGGQQRAGRLLLARHNCLKCHPAFEGDPSAFAPLLMPEALRDTPDLGEVGARLQADWMTEWILAPASLRNKTTMPAVLSHLPPATARQTAVDIAAYLATLQGEPGDKQSIEPAPAADAVRLGEGLYEERGCIACHRFTPPDQDDRWQRVSLHYLSAKFQPDQVAQFLANPRRHYRWSRMPHAPLEPVETRQLAAYLASRSQGSLPLAAVDATPAGDPVRGAELFQSVGCVQCHARGKTPPLPARAATLASLLAAGHTERGCLAEEVAGRGSAPDVQLAAEDKTAVREFLKASLESLTRDTADDFSQRQWKTMSCRACHARDGVDAILPAVLYDEGERGLPPDPVPDLTWAGEKLQPQWTQRLLAGLLPYRPRPHFHLRMPALPARGDLLSQGICFEHGFALDENPQPAWSEPLAETGSQVAAMQNGLACHRCHAIGDQQATAPFEARSTNLSFAADRLRYRFYHRWMRDPMRVEPATKMIKFAPDGLKTGLDRYYKGDAHQQFESVWHYLHALHAAEKPEPAASDP